MDNRIILLLTSHKLTIFDSFIGEGKSLSFPESAVKHLEIVNKEQLESQIKDFVGNMSPQHGVMLLAKDVVFQKSLPASEENIDVKTADFFGKVPFGADKKTLKKIEAGGQIYLFSTNLEFYKTIIECLVGDGWGIDQVVPVGVFPRLIDKTSFSPEEIGDILDSKDVLEQSNFISNEEFVVESAAKEEVASVNSNWKKIFLIVMCVVLVIGALGAGAYWYSQFYAKSSENNKVEEIPKKLEEASPSATAVATLDKSKLKLQVLNGSGIVGQAGGIKDKLAKAGFENIKTGNLPDKRLNASASFAAVVAKPEREEILKVLEDIFIKVDTEESSDSGEFDVHIITGSKLK